MISFMHPLVSCLLVAAIFAGVIPVIEARRKSEEQDIIQNLVANRQLINRNVSKTPNGIQASTWSLDDNVSGWIKTHVQQMKALMDSNAGIIRQWDELFQKAFELRDFHHMNVNYTDNGVEVKQIGDNDCAISIVQAHAQVVSQFIERGQAEVMSNHQVPQVCSDVETLSSGTISNSFYLSVIIEGVIALVLL